LSIYNEGYQDPAPTSLLSLRVQSWQV